jgi:hypothetical protein
MDLQNMVLRWNSFVGSSREHKGSRLRSGESTVFFDTTSAGDLR